MRRICGHTKGQDGELFSSAKTFVYSPYLNRREGIGRFFRPTQEGNDCIDIFRVITAEGSEASSD